MPPPPKARKRAKNRHVPRAKTNAGREKGVFFGVDTRASAAYAS
jgi:hypothetical protein